MSQEIGRESKRKEKTKNGSRHSQRKKMKNEYTDE
jgi:hypothetical protein